ncbi:hypothetical protein QOZ80_3AG0238170 [Eleusine coracana subsp. coracana]|nr:hypothetical protein QOZ80_3AG0238170 [Eleusine coracana subsp. coracana]
MQFKNKWSKLKVEYTCWKTLLKQTGIGWDERKQNIQMPESWWKKARKDIPGCGKFKLQRLQNEDELRIIFEDLRNTGDDHFGASSGLIPEESPLINLDVDEEGSSDDVDSEEEEEEVSPPPKGKGKMGIVAATDDKGKRPKTSEGIWMQDQMSSSESDNESDVTASDDDNVSASDVQVLKKHLKLQASLVSTVSIIYDYYMAYYDKNPPRTSQLSGYAWVLETLNTPGESHRMFRMNERLFVQLHDLLVRQLVENLMRIRGDRKLWPHFKGCIGAIDGTHIGAVPPPRDYVRYIGRSGSMHDTSVLFHAIDHDDTFPHPPQGKYYMVDAGYPNRPGYMAPYKGQRYHVPDWRRGAAPRGEQETFNYHHSRTRNVVERTFGVWKQKWRILFKMPSYPISKQKMIVAATMCLHNFIRENHALDRHFRRCDRDPEYIPTIPHRYARHAPPPNASDASTSSTNDISMDMTRDDLAAAILQSSA